MTEAGNLPAKHAPPAQPAPEKPYLVRWSHLTMMKLALCSACTIATLLCIPDGAGIIPDVRDFFTWLVRVIGLWFCGFYLWTVGFLCLLYAVRWFSRGVELHADGLKLWRLGKRIPYDAVLAVVCESQPFFSRMFCLHPPVHKLTIYFDKRQRSRLGDKRRGAPEVGSQTIGSMYLADTDFQSLLVFLSDKIFTLTPSSLDLALARTEAQPLLHKAYQHTAHMRTFVSCIILLSLTLFLVRKATVNYCYNQGVREFRLEHYANAESSFKAAAKADNSFAPAWDYLARSEYRQGKNKLAEADWRRALVMRPDLVEAKIGLSNVLARRGELPAALKLLQSAIRLSPTNLSARINLADVEWRLGDRADAIVVEQEVVHLDPDNLRARANLAHMYAQQGNLQDARVEIEHADGVKPRLQADNTLFQLVRGEVAAAGTRAEESRGKANAAGR